MDSNKTTARIVGMFFLTAIAAYSIGDGLIESVLDTSDYLINIPANQIQMSAGAILILINSAVVIGIGLLMFPILKKYNESIALGYVVFRLLESVILIVGLISLLSLIPLSQEYIKTQDVDILYLQELGKLAIDINYFAYQIAMIMLGIGSFLFCYLLYQSKLIPRLISVWGFIGYAGLLTGALLEIFNFNVGLFFSIPGGLFEIVLPIWLFVKGFNLSTDISESNN